MKDIIKKGISSFFTSAVIGMICLLIIESITRACGENFSPLTPEFIALFPSQTIAMEVDVLLYGVFGLAFSTMSFIYEQDKIGFVLQNMIYAFGTGAVWIPIVIFMWQLYKYPQALISTIAGFFVTYIIMTIVMYKKIQSDLRLINREIELIKD